MLQRKKFQSEEAGFKSAEYLFHTWGVSGHILNSVHDISI